MITFPVSIDIIYTFLSLFKFNFKALKINLFTLMIK